MRTLCISLIFACTAFASSSAIHVCNERTCYDQKIEAIRYEWKTASNGDRFVRVYKPDGTLVDITGRDLKVEFKKTKDIKRKHK